MIIVDRCAPSFRAAARPTVFASFVLLLTTSAALPRKAQAQAGHEFWLAWPETGDATGEDPGYDLGAQLILLAAGETVRVRVTGPGLDTTVTARPDQPALVQLSRSAHQVTELDRPVAKGIHLAGQSCQPFAALLRVPGTGASVADDVARLLPRALLGRRYYPVSALGMAEFAVVATEDGTLVTIDDPVCSSPPPTVLDEGEVFLHRCEGGPDGGDVTGTVVDASAPVAVLSGSVSSRVLAIRDGGQTEVFWDFADVLLEGNWPADLLGKTHVHVPFRRTDPLATGDALRLIASCPGTRTWVEPQEGGSWLHDVASDADHGYLGEDAAHPQGAVMPDAAVLTSTRPVQVAAYTTGQTHAGIGDPSMTLLDPEERWQREVLAWLPEGYEHSLGLAIRRGGQGSVRINGSPPAGTWRNASSSGTHVWLRVDGVAAGLHRITADEPLSVQVSGFTAGGQPGAYSYPGIGLAGDGRAGVRIETDGTTCASACPGTCFEVSVPAGFVEADWSTGDTGLSATVCPGGPETLTVTARDARGCVHEGSLELLVQRDSAPPPIEGPATTCAGECIVLRAPPNSLSYAWSTGGDEREEIICPDAALTVEVILTDRNGCNRTLTHDLAVRPAPLMGEVTILDPDPCVPLLELAWAPATWPDGTAPGVYHVYRREGDCAPPDDPSWEPIATGLTEEGYTDLEAGRGIDWSYLVVAEADDAPSGCRPGPAWGGSTGHACATPGGVSSPAPPPPPPSISPWLRVGQVERAAPGGPATAVTLSWSGAPAPGTEDGLELLKGDRPQLLLPRWISPGGESWRDAAAGDAPLLFYRLRRVGPCGEFSD